VLTDRHVNEAMFAPGGLYLQERQQGADLLFHRGQPDEAVEFGLNFGQRARRTNALRRPRSAAALCQNFFCVAPGQLTCFQQAFANVVRSCDVPKLLEEPCCPTPAIPRFVEAFDKPNVR
jgi:hypothetical protein